MQLNQTIMQDMQVLKKPVPFTTVSKAECYVCGRGLEDGLVITPHVLPSGTVLLCDRHSH